MSARFKITKVVPATFADPEGVVGIVGFVWKPDEYDEINLSRSVKNDEDKWERKAAGRIEGATRVSIFAAPIREYTNKKTGETGHFLALDGVNVPFEIAAEIIAAALPMLAEAGADQRMADAAQTPTEEIPL